MINYGESRQVIIAACARCRLLLGSGTGSESRGKRTGRLAATSSTHWLAARAPGPGACFVDSWIRAAPSVSRMGRPRRPLLVPLFALVVVAHQDAVAQPATFAKCDSAEPKQQWCLSADGEIRDHWGRCLSRHDCTPQTAGKGTAVFVDNCGVGACAGSQNWKLDADTKHIAAAIHAPCDTHLKAGQAKPIDGDLCNCLDISVANNVAQTFTCKDKDVVGGVEKGYCGEANQEWTLEEDGTFSVPIPPKAMCKAVMDPGCKMPPTGDGCGKVCLVTATPPAGKPPDTVTGHGACIVTAGDLGWQFACLVIGSFALYLCGGVAQGKRKDSALPWREALPHRAFWRNTLGLVVDGVRFTTGKPLGVGGYEPLPVARESQNGTDKRAEALSPPPPPPVRVDAVCLCIYIPAIDRPLSD